MVDRETKIGGRMDISATKLVVSSVLLSVEGTHITPECGPSPIRCGLLQTRVGRRLMNITTWVGAASASANAAAIFGLEKSTTTSATT